VFTQKSSNVNGPRKIEKAKIGLIQFCISPPKTDVSNSIHNFYLFLFIYLFIYEVNPCMVVIIYNIAVQQIYDETLCLVIGGYILFTT